MPGGAAEPQGHIVQGGGQLPGDRGVGQGMAASKPGLLTAAEGLLDVEQEDKQLELLQMGLLACTLEHLRGQQLQLVVM